MRRRNKEHELQRGRKKEIKNMGRREKGGKLRRKELRKHKKRKRKNPESNAKLN